MQATTNTKASRGRPLTYVTDAERKDARRQRNRRYYESKMALRAERADVMKPLHSKVIDLSELRAWERR